MRIDRLELYHVRSPLPAPLHVAAQPGHGQTHNELTFVRMTTDDGVVGESAGMTLSRFHTSRSCPARRRSGTWTSPPRSQARSSPAT